MNVRLAVNEVPCEAGKEEGRSHEAGAEPCFKSYYIGVCAGNNFPYTPSPGEKKQYCMTADFHLCLIYEQYLAGRERDRK